MDNINNIPVPNTEERGIEKVSNIQSIKPPFSFQKFGIGSSV